ncbi:unnamed protein product [Effrenium voratum]|nr:unnamed protein product [Effrenium voratum]
MVVGQTKGPPATEMGIKEGWKLVQWGSKADALTTFSPDVDKGVIRESYVSLIKQLPKEGTAGENAVPSGEETASWIPGRWAYEMDVTIVSASGLRDADWAPGGGSSDPYCVCTLQGRGKSTFKTKVVKNNKSPVWNHSARINDMYDGDQLFFEVFDHDVVGSHDSLGHASVGWEELPAESTTLKIKRSLDDSGHKSARNQAGEATLELKIQVVKRRVEMASASAPEKPQHRLQVNIRSARGLRDADSFFGGGSSDPYCVCSIVGLGKSKYSTRAINDQTDPEWDEKCVLADFHKGDKLLCEIYDKDIGKKDDFLGKCEIPSEKILLHGFDGEVKLVETGMVGKKQVESFLSLAVTARKRDPIGLAPFQSCPKAAPGSVRYEMEVTILSADGLRNADWLGSGSDPYCLCTVRGKGGASFRTPTVQNQHCPVWNHMEKITDFLHGDALYLSVKDSDKLKYDDILGEVSLTTEQIVPGGFEGDLKLRNTGHKAPDKTPAFVTVAIKLLARYPVKPDEPKTEKVKDGKTKEKKAKA